MRAYARERTKRDTSCRKALLHTACEWGDKYSFCVGETPKISHRVLQIYVQPLVW